MKGTLDNPFSISALLLSATVIPILTATFAFFIKSDDKSSPDASSDTVLSADHRDFQYGFDPAVYELDHFTLEEDQFLGTILDERGVPYEVIDEIARKAEDVYSVRRLRPGKRCAIVRRKGTGYVDCFVYQPNAYEYVLYHLYEEPRVEIRKEQVEKCIEYSSGRIEGSLWLTMSRLGHPFALISRMEDALAWEVSFQHVENGDEYKLIYERDYIDGVPVGVGKLLGASFTTHGDTSYAIYFETENYDGFFDLEARPMKRAFLKAPVRYSRISSRYSTRRFHPVLKRYKGHYGTDYAAPYGTEIYAVADGIITKASYTSGNGNYVKIRHDNVYETQYLHMSRFAKGIRPGVKVKQGEVIGYVGATGLATGPHVCFRFWKNGRQVDHLRENLPPPEPMSEELVPLFMAVRDHVIPQLNHIPVIDDLVSADLP